MTNKQLEMHVNSKYNSVMTQESICLLCHCRIKENALFTELTDEQLKLFQDFVVTSFYKKRDVIFIEGDACPGFYVVKNGRVKLIKTSRDGKEQIIKILQAGELLGMETFYNCKKDYYCIKQRTRPRLFKDRKHGTYECPRKDGTSS